MSQTRTPTVVTRLFPLDSDFVAVSTRKTDDPKEIFKQRYGLSRHAPGEFRCLTGDLDNHFDPCFLPSGEYFRQSTSYSVSGDQAIEGYKIQLDNITYNNWSSWYINEKLNTSLIAMTKDTPYNRQVVGVTEDGKSLFLYKLREKPDFYSTHTNAQRVTQFVMEPFWKDNKFKVSQHLYTLEDDKQIVSIAGFSKLPEHLLAVALNTGEIILGDVNDDQPFVSITLGAPAQEQTKPLQLFGTPEGLLIAWSFGSTTMRVWDLKNPENKLPVIHPCPKWYNLSVSVDGKYLTGLEMQDGEVSDKVYCCELPTFKQQDIKLDAPVADFVIGKNGRVCTIGKFTGKFQDSEAPTLFGGKGIPRSFPGKITDLLPKQPELTPPKRKHKFLELFSGSKPADNKPADEKRHRPERAPGVRLR